MVVTSMELAVSIQTTPQRLMQSLKDIKIENISNESPLTAGEESSLTNSVRNNTIPTGMYINTQNMTNPTIFSLPLFIIIFRPEMLKFHPYSILTGNTMVEFVIFCVLKSLTSEVTPLATQSFKRAYKISHPLRL